MIDLDQTTITRQGDDLVIVHKKTGARVVVSVKQLDRWGLGKLRTLFA